MLTARTYSVPEHITMFGAGCAGIGVIYPSIMAHTGGHGIPCPLMTLTGVPCPFCGLTTATVALTHGQMLAAVQVSPLACLVALLVVMTAPVLIARVAGISRPARPWSLAARRRTRWVVSAIVALNWLFELHRFAIL